MRVLRVVLGAALAGMSVAAATAADGASSPASSSTSSLIVPRCLVSLIEEARVPAQEAGVLTALEVREGQPVSVGEVLGQIDPTQALTDKTVAEVQLKVATARAENDIDVQYYTAASEVAQTEYQSALEVNRQRPRTVPDMEVNRLRLVAKKADLQVEQANRDREIAAMEVEVRQAEVDTAVNQLARREIRSPLDGIVIKRFLHAHEWVMPGDPVVHVVRMDRLRVEGFVEESRFAPWEIADRPVLAEVELSGGRRERFPGRIVFVSPLVQADGTYLVWAEVDNRKQDGYWLLRPGQIAQMTIDLGGTPGTP
jgi:multidrug efflux pump subunit AcrA (membrane-fusion protein)